MMQIGAYAAPDVESSLLPKSGDHPLVSLAKARIAVREGDFDRAATSGGRPRRSTTNRLEFSARR